MSEPTIQENLNEIRRRIENVCIKSGRNPDEVTLIAVSKTKPNEAILEAYRTSHVHFGENKMQELEEKMSSINRPDIQWHMIGTMQSNKIKYIANRVNWIHSVPKAKYLTEIQKRAKDANRVINVLIQVNISGEEQKSGCNPSELKSILLYAQALTNVRIRGLMGLATFTDNLDQVRAEFALLRKIRDQHTDFNSGSIDLKELSMGMSNDFEIAIEEGATMVRVGSSIFGSRNYG